MDLDPTLYSPHNDAAPARTPSPPTAPVPAFDLPSAPRPSVSPSVSRVFQKKQHDSAPTMSRGLDLSVPPSPHRHDSLTSSGSSAQDDPRDTASARDNIQALVSAGQRSLGSSSSSSSTAPSLAMFMGGGTQRRTHRVGTGMTEQEKEETERLEREMAATRAKWGDKGDQGDADPPRGGLSLADLMKGGKGGASASPVAAKVAQRFHAEPERASSAPAAAPAKSPDVAPPAAQPLVEAKIVSRSPPAEAEEPAPPQKSASAPPPAVAHPSPPPSSEPVPAAFTAEPETATLPRSASFGLGAASNTLTRLQSSGVVADRLKWTEALQQPSAADAPPAQPSAPPSPEKRRSVLERWGRDEPNAGAPASPSRQRSFALDAGAGRDEVRKGADDLFSPKNEDKASSSAGSSAPAAPAEAASPTKSGYSKPTWSAAPIGVKEPSRVFSPPPVTEDDEPTSPPARHTRGVALPGLGPSGSSAPKPAPSPSLSSRPTPLAFPSEPSSPVRTRTQSSDAPPASPGRPSVRAAAQRWGQTAVQSAAEKSEALQALKASYGVKLGPTRGATMPASSALPSAAAAQQERRTEVEAPVKSKSVEVPAHTPAPAQDKKEPANARRTVSPVPQPKPASTPSPAAAPTAASRSTPAPAKPAPSSSSTSRTLADDVVAALLAPRHVAHLPPGEVLSLDVFHLNSPSDDPHPIDHNHMLFESEVVGVVYRAAAPGEGEGEGDEGILTRTWVWRGRDAQPTARTEERIARLGEKTGTTPVEVQSGAEGAELAEAFAGQLTVCRGARDSFDHLAQRMFSVQSYDDAVFVEEGDVSIRTLCSGYATVFSSLGEVYAWLGEGSTDLERHAACEFAESLADGRSVEVLAEGEETALFWHQLAADGAEYANAHYWRYRPHHPQTASVVRFSPSPACTDRFSILPTPALSPDHVSLLDAGFAESWIVVPEKVLVEKKGDVELALEAAEKLAAKWEERGFGARTPFHVLLTPSLLPRDLPFLSRSLDLTALNAGSKPRKMRVYTAQEARDELF